MNHKKAVIDKDPLDCKCHFHVLWSVLRPSAWMARSL